MSQHVSVEPTVTTRSSRLAYAKRLRALATLEAQADTVDPALAVELVE